MPTRLDIAWAIEQTAVKSMDIHLPGLLAGLIVGAYWARVLRMVYKFRRTTGRAANFVPPELLGRLLRIVWYPAVALWVFLPLLSALRVKTPPFLRRLYEQPVVEWLAVCMAAAALSASLACWRRMGKSWRMGIDPDERTRLIVTGPYAFVRHPIYALSSLLMLATVVAVPTPAMLIVATIHLLFLQWEARREEKYLVKIHGIEYQQYLRHVGRFLPRSASRYVSRALVNS
jgi:protein-S-isoprenylcysteine O-methyltransferase Ste14